MTDVTIGRADPSVTIKTVTPDGNLFTIIVEDNAGRPKKIMLMMGKSGSALQSWCDVTAQLCTLLLGLGRSINELIEAVSNITSDRVKSYDNGLVCRSGPEGLAIALMKYRKGKR